MGKNGIASSMALMAVCGCFGARAVEGRTLEQYLEAQKNGAPMEQQTGYYCNTKAFTPEERVRHEAATKRLLAMRKQTVETEKGYEFQYSPADVTVQEIAEWVVRESKCCPFFDFHIDLENEGKLICLRLTGNPEVKKFIKSEFGLT